MLARFRTRLDRFPGTALVALLALLPACGGGRGPSAPSGTSSPAPLPTPPPPTGTLAIAVVDGSGQPVPGAAVRVDGGPRSPRVPGGHVFDIERSLTGRPLDIDKGGFLIHETVVPDADRSLDLFAVPPDGSKAWIRALLYDGVISTSGTLARLLHPVSIVRGASVPPEAWAEVRSVWEQAAEQISDVTGYAFRLAAEPLAGSITYTIELDPTLTYGGYFNWSGHGNVIATGTIRFRGPGPLGAGSLVLHELTHGFGLSHSDRTSDVMHPSAVSSLHSERERVVIEAVRRRPPNTAFEDNVRDATRALARGLVTREFVCGQR